MDECPFFDPIETRTRLVMDLIDFKVRMDGLQPHCTEKDVSVLEKLIELNVEELEKMVRPRKAQLYSIEGGKLNDQTDDPA